MSLAQKNKKNAKRGKEKTAVPKLKDTLRESPATERNLQATHSPVPAPLQHPPPLRLISYRKGISLKRRPSKR